MRVVVIEDDPLVRAFAVVVLEDEGFEVIEAESAEEGLERCRDTLPDVLFTDIRLPGPLSGWDIAERCRESHPEIPVIYATGFSDEKARPVPGSVLFQKPYKAAQLISTIRGLTP
jgi:CheY-like chemotaxis protein